MKLSKELKEKLLGADQEGLGTRIANMNQIANLKLSILVPVKFRSPIWTTRHKKTQGTFACANLLQTCCKLVVYVTDLLATHNGEVTNLLRTCYEETGVMDLALTEHIKTRARLLWSSHYAAHSISYGLVIGWVTVCWWVNLLSM